VACSADCGMLCRLWHALPTVACSADCGMLCRLWHALPTLTYTDCIPQAVVGQSPASTPWAAFE
jgi:hypothetical protein